MASAMDFAARMRNGKDGGGDGKGEDVNGRGEENNGDGGGGMKKRKRKKRVGGNNNTNNLLSIPGIDEEYDESGGMIGEGMEGKKRQEAKLRVKHDVSDFVSGSTTILTLVDRDILDNDNDVRHGGMIGGDGDDDDGGDMMNELTNVDMDDRARTDDNMRKKRMVELGSGRAGGYSGYDDHEFDETGGIGVGIGGGGVLGDSSGLGVGGGGGGGGRGGFAINARGGAVDARGGMGEDDPSSSSGLFGGVAGSRNARTAISLAPRDPMRVASDFLSHEDIVAVGDYGNDVGSSSLEKERRRREKMLAKMRKKDDKRKAKDDKRKEKRKSRRGRRGGEDDSDDEDGNDERGVDVEGGRGGRADDDGKTTTTTTTTTDLLTSLEATAVANVPGGFVSKGRRRGNDSDDENDVDGTTGVGNGVEIKTTDRGRENGNDNDDDDDERKTMDDRRRKFDAIMEKGKVRTDRAFGGKASTARNAPPSNKDDNDVDEGDDDDAFLNAALAKARRLKRLREMSGGGAVAAENAATSKIGADDAVALAVERIKREEEASASAAAASVVDGDARMGGVDGGRGEGITFEFDEIQEFTRALRAREDQARRGIGERGRGGGRGVSVTVSGAPERIESRGITAKDVEATERVGGRNDDDDGDADMQEMARGMDVDEQDTNDREDDDNDGGFGTTAEYSAPIGRGMSNFLSHLRHTGEIRDHSTKEEMRGRAKDKRTYEDYEKLDLSSVVKIDVDRNNVHEKDAELSRREIKLEYRDEHGRLLTRKEAYRDMCYQFHGHGSSKKNQERRLRQIEREQKEYSKSNNAGLSSGGNAGGGGGVGTLGALRATQKATGKAFIIHKT
jgi:U4/U6.U5 tri-snRNP-associated protein 1